MMVPGLFRDLNASDPISSDHCCVRCGALSCDAGSETRADPDTCDERKVRSRHTRVTPPLTTYTHFTFYTLRRSHGVSGGVVRAAPLCDQLRLTVYP